MTSIEDNNLSDPKDLLIEDWHDVDWKLVNKGVTNLRYRIFISCKNKNFKKAKRLQKLMLKSNSNLLQSIRKVTQLNQGKHTPGMDDLIISTPKERLKLFYEMKSEGIYSWQPKPVVRVYIPKPDGRTRPLGIPTIKDRIWQNVVRNALEPEWECKFEDSSYGFRPSRSFNDALNRIYVATNKKTRMWIVDADIKSCFDEIAHDPLLEKLKHFPACELIKKWLKAGILTNGIWQESLGTPQGGVISPLLCNIALHGMETDLKIKRSSQGFVVGPRNFIRYADDFVILCTSYEEAKLALADVQSSLAKRGLVVAPNKTRIVHLVDGFDFLGFTIKLHVLDNMNPKNFFVKESTIEGTNCYLPFDTSKTLLLIKPSKKSIDNFKKSVKEVFTKYKQARTSLLIKELNPILRGWALSKNSWHSNRTFHKLDHYIFNLCWRWMHRVHPNKSNWWLKQRYYKHLQKYGIDNKWVFTDPQTGIFLYQLKWTRNSETFYD